MVTEGQYKGFIEGKSKEQLLKDIGKISQVGSPVYEQMKLAITVKCTQDLEKSILELKRKINFLDIMLIVASVIGAIATGLMA